MRKRRLSPVFVPIILVAALLLIGRFAGRMPPGAGPAGETVNALAAIQAERKIINVHEHVEGIADAERLLHVMDRFGIHKSILMGSSYFTITLSEQVGFTRYDENNEELLRIARAYPDRFEAWPTINPADPDKLEKFKSLVEQGATGLKLYLGHGYVKRSDGQYMFHVTAMDDPSMLPVYAYCQENFIPICFHVNPGPTTPGFAEEFIAVLTQFPDLKIICPHFMLSSIRDSRLQELLDTFPNLYSDVSFGHDDFLSDGVKRISGNLTKFRGLFEKYPDRFMWGTDLVVTAHPSKTEPWMAERIQTYLDMLTKDRYTTPVATESVTDPATGRTQRKPAELRGLQLRRELLERILYKNFEEFIAKRPRGTRITREIVWTRMGVERTNRQPGQALPPPRD